MSSHCLPHKHEIVYIIVRLFLILASAYLSRSFHPCFLVFYVLSAPYACLFTLAHHSYRLEQFYVPDSISAPDTLCSSSLFASTFLLFYRLGSGIYLHTTVGTFGTSLHLLIILSLLSVSIPPRKEEKDTLR